MGNYRFDDNIHKKNQLPAGQRGIGCMMILLLPVISYVAAATLLQGEEVRRTFYRVSPKLFGPPNIHPILWKVDAIKPLLYEIYSWTDLEAKILLGLLILLFLSGVIGLIYAIMYKAVAPKRRDAPPPRRKPSKKSR